MVFESSFASMHNVKGSLWISFWISDPENVKFGYEKREKFGHSHFYSEFSFKYPFSDRQYVEVSKGLRFI